MIQLVNICKSFGNNKIHNNLSYKFENNGLYIISGDNGCGKTSLLYILALLDNVYNGEYFYNGININGLKKREIEKIRANDFSIIFSKGNLISFLTVEENLLLGTSLNKIDMKNFDIDCTRRADNLSGGEEILIALEREKILQKKIILLDEVTSSLDDENLMKIMEALVELSIDKLIILVSHDERSFKYGKLLKLEKGKLLDYFQQ